VIETAKLRKKRGRPRKVVIVEDASGTDFPTTDDEAISGGPPNHCEPATSPGDLTRSSAVTQPAEMEVEDSGTTSLASAGPPRPPAAAFDLMGRARVTRQERALHGTDLVAPLPVTARMLVVQDDGESARPPLPQQPAPPPPPSDGEQREDGTEQRARAMRGNGTGSRKRARHNEHDDGGPRRTVTMIYNGATAETAASRREHLEAL
jgi:hypothetical protein